MGKSFFSKIADGFSLGLYSCKFIIKNTSILLYPLFSGLALFLSLYYSFHLLLMTLNFGSQTTTVISTRILLFTSIYLLIYIGYVICIFFNVASFFAINSIIKKDNKIPLFTSLIMASSKLPQILLWALVSSTVGILLRIFEAVRERLRIPASVVFFDMAWSGVAFFIIPIICYNSSSINPFAMIKESVKTMKNGYDKGVITSLISSSIFSSVIIMLTGLPFIYFIVSFYPNNAIVGSIICFVIINVLQNLSKLVIRGYFYEKVVSLPEEKLLPVASS